MGWKILGVFAGLVTAIVVTMVLSTAGVLVLLPFFTAHGTTASRDAEALQLRDAESLEPLVGLCYFEFNAITFIEGLETLATDDRKVDENILSTFILRNEAEALLVIKPLDGALSHAESLLR